MKSIDLDVVHSVKIVWNIQRKEEKEVFFCCCGFELSKLVRACICVCVCNKWIVVLVDFILVARTFFFPSVLFSNQNPFKSKLAIVYCLNKQQQQQNTIDWFWIFFRVSRIFICVRLALHVVVVHKLISKRQKKKRKKIHIDLLLKYLCGARFSIIRCRVCVAEARRNEKDRSINVNEPYTHTHIHF